MIQVLTRARGTMAQMVTHMLPQALRGALLRARDVEWAATGRDQKRRAAHASSVLLLAGYEAGWTYRDMAAVLGLSGEWVRQRVNAERLRRAETGRTGSGLQVPTPARSPSSVVSPSVPKVTSLPVEERDRLTTREVAAAVGTDVWSVNKWRCAGLMPLTLRESNSRYLYARVDVERIIAATRHPTAGIDRNAVRALISKG